MEVGPARSSGLGLLMALKGDCNRCGLCCRSGDFRCINLIVTGEPGQPFATKCGVHSRRYDGLPIVMVNSEGKIHEGDFYCAHGSPKETETIIERGIGKGCSLTLEV